MRDPEQDLFRRPWLSVLVGLAILGYAIWWLAHPSTQGFESGFGVLGRVLKWVTRQSGPGPVGFFFVVLGLSVLSVGVWGLVRKR